MDLSRQSPVKRVALQEDSSSLLASLPTMSNRTKSGIMANKLPAVAQMCKLQLAIWDLTSDQPLEQIPMH